MFNFINSVKIKNDESCLALLTACKTGSIICTVINSKIEETLINAPLPGDDEKKFIEQIYFDNKIYNAVIVNASIRNSKEFREGLRNKLNKLKIPNYFISYESFIYSTLLIASNTSINFDETVLTIIVGPNAISCAELKYSSTGYKTIREDEIKLDKNYKASKIREQILQSSTPKKIFALQYPSSTPIKTILKSKKLVVYSKNISNYQDKFLVETCRWLLDKSYTKYFILPTYARSCHVATGYNQADIITFPPELDDRKTILSARFGDRLPLAKSVVFHRSVLQCWIQIFIDKQSRECQKVELNRNCHRFRFSLNVDAESFETYNIEQLILDEIKNLPERLDTVIETRIPVIGFFDNSSVVCINKNGSYQFVESCGGLTGMENFISFAKKKPKYGEAALSIMYDKASYVVFDLLKIMSMPNDKIELDETWGFKITKNSENPVLIEYDDCNNPGKRTAASPAFLVALIIKKQYFKAIKTETGESPKEIGVWIYDQFNEDEMKRIKEGFEEACKLIKVKCNFVDC